MEKVQYAKAFKVLLASYCNHHTITSHHTHFISLKTSEKRE